MKDVARIMLYLPPNLAEWLTQNAKEMGMARNELIIRLLTAGQRELGRQLLESELAAARKNRTPPASVKR